MPCYHPKHGYRSRKTGGFTTARSEAYVDLPMTISCANCIGCRLDKSREWAIRCVHESQMHNYNSYLTLTYDDEHLPVDLSLNVQHWQQFAKRYRQYLKRTADSVGDVDPPFRYFHCGEYGDKKRRPHYHAAVFGQDFVEDRQFDKDTEAGHPLYRSELLDHLWGHGRCWIGELTFDSAAYVARYILKKINGIKKWDHYGYTVDKSTGELLDLVLKPEYVTMSRNPGIGSSWIQKYMSDVYPRDEVICKGMRCTPPKFYDLEYKEVNPEGYRKLIAKRQKEGQIHEENNTWQRLMVREHVATAKANLYSKRD